MLDLFNPVHNLKEICKEFVLLEDHLQAPEKRCPDCIRKHLLKAEAFAEEAIALDKTGEHLEVCKPLPTQIREIQKAFNDGENDHLLGQRVRMIRKKLSPLCFSANAKGSGSVNRSTELTLNEFCTNIAKSIGGSKVQQTSIAKGLKSLSMPQKPWFTVNASGVSARIRKSDAWLQKKIISLLENGQVKRLIGQNKEFPLSVWQGAIKADVYGDYNDLYIDTPSSSIGEYLKNDRLKERAFNKAKEYKVIRSLEVAMKSERSEPLKSADLYHRIGKRIGSDYWLIKAATIYENLGQMELESSCYELVLEQDPNHPLSFWIENKTAINNGMIEPEKKSKPLKALLALGIGFLVGIV